MDLAHRPALATRLMTSGGDARIILDAASGLNRYGTAPRPAATLAYASSTANDMSGAAFDHVCGLALLDGPLTADGYDAALEALRARIRAAYDLPDAIAIVFTPSGTDLEYVAIHRAADRGGGRVHNILLGADEVGSGCIHSAGGRYFAEETALAAGVAPGQPVPGLSDEIGIVDIPVRDSDGAARSSAAMAAAIDAEIGRAAAAGRHPLVHVVHGSKTGLVLPELDDLDRLIAAHGDALTIAVDACQARIGPGRVKAYLDRGAIVFLTGSKFMGGPPFSGFALLPAGMRPPLSAGFETLSRRAEWPRGWPGAERLAATANFGLLLRLEAAVFELERFAALPTARIERVIAAFGGAVDALAGRIGARRIAAGPASAGHPVESGTLATLDLSDLWGDFDEARRRHMALAAAGARLGQPVKCVRRADGGWGATIRIALSMPQMVALDRLPDDALASRLAGDMARIADGLREMAIAA